jgi:predicted O-methyltransferase YrrM
MVLVNPIYSLEDNSSYNQLCLENSNLSCLASLTPSPTESKGQPQFGPSEEEKQALIENLNKEIGKWMDLSVFCQSLRNIVEVDGDVSFFHGKRILEIGFTTGLPAIYALEKFAESVMVVCANKEILEASIKPTFSQSKDADRVDCTVGDVTELENVLEADEYDVILAPELIHTSVEDFERIHDTLYSLLAYEGVILFSGHAYYSDSNGNMQSILDIIKQKDKFEAVDRTPSTSESDPCQRKVIQLMHKQMI